MSKRSQKRAKMVLPIRVWGMDAGGKPFASLAHTLDINHHGARLGGLRTTLKVGDIIGLQYRHNKGRFRVIWVGQPESVRATQVGLEIVEHAKEFWGLEGPEISGHDEYIEEAAPVSVAVPMAKLRARLHSVQGTVEIREQGAKASYWAKVTQVGEQGCLIEARHPSEQGAHVTLTLTIWERPIVMNGVVRSSRPGAAMMVDFTQPGGVGDAIRLKALVWALESGTLGARPPARPPVHEASQAGPEAIFDRLQTLREDLGVIESTIATTELDGNIREEFREAATHMRNTAAIVQRCFEVEQADADALLATLNTNRIRTAVRICKAIGAEMRRDAVDRSRHEIRELMSAVEDLFTLLAGLNFTVGDEVPMTEMATSNETAAAPLEGQSLVELEDIALTAHLAHFHEHKARKKRKL